MPTLKLAPEQSEILLRVIEAAPQVCRRHQFFVWSQGDFQRWVPHKISVCGSYDRDQRGMVFDIFNSVPVPEEVLLGLRNGASELMLAAMQAWRRGRHQACRMPLQSADAQDLRHALAALGYGEVMVHGVHRPGRPEELESFFLFTQSHMPFCDADQLALDMLLPCLHVAYQRVCATERQLVANRNPMSYSTGQPQPRVAPITEREREILLWVRDGMSNQQISEQLGISALTVKNHVQKILRKLGAANRAQAVAKAMAMNALSMVNTSPGDLY